MAFQILGALGLGYSLFSGIMGNKAADKQARAQEMAARIAAADKKDRAAKAAAANVGRLAVGSADRNAFGRSSQAIELSELAKNAEAEESINSDLSLRIMSIDQRAANSKVDLIGASISGLSAGLEFGDNLNTLFGD